ncbi:unnamed protein product [Prunus armeniaca]
MLGLRYALGLDGAFDLQDNKCSVRPRVLVWYWPKALRCLSKYGFSKIELQINRQYANFDVGLWTPIVGLPRVHGGEVALIVRSVGTVRKLGVPQVLLREFSEGDLKLSSAGNVVLLFEGRVELTCEETSGRFVFRDSREMSDSESFFERDPNAFDGESSDDLFDSDSDAVGPDAKDGSDTDVEILGEGHSSIPLHGIGKGLMIAPVPLPIVYSDDHHVGLAMPGETSAGR